MRRLLLPLLALAPALAACHRGVPLPALAAGGDIAALVARGEYVVRTVAACGGCHAADPEHDPDGPLSGGLAFHDWRLGTVRASNLTPDSATGLGAWRDAEIVRALRDGASRDGRLLAPVMPYEWLHGLSDDDALAVARYLRTLPPVRHRVRQQPGLLFRLGRSTFMRPLGATSVAAPPRGATAEYGRYLADGPGLCADCHTARGGLMSRPDRAHLFAGSAQRPADFPVAPANLTPDSTTGIGAWSEADFVRALRTGVTPHGDTLDRFMPWPQKGRMTDDDLRAIWLYLRTVPPVHRVVPRRRAAPA